MATNGPSEKSQGEGRKSFLALLLDNIVFLTILVAIAIVVVSTLIYLAQDPALGWLGAAGVVLMVIAGAAGTAIFEDRLAVRQRQKHIVEIERKVEDAPDKPKLAWDLASAKLEDYLARNLSQVRSIYYLVLFVMFIGFVFIGYGIYFVYYDAKIEASIVAAVSGILVQFIGATFLLIYRSTMEQAKDYVAMLERINAVGMSVQLVESIEDPDPKVRDEVRADLASSLLEMYGKAPKT